MKVNPYVMYSGTCEEAFKFYAEVTGGQIVAMMKYGQMPGDNPMPAELTEKIVHARLIIGDSALMGGDAPPDRFTAPTTGTFVSLLVDTPEEAERIFARLSDGANVIMPMEETFWADRFGMLVDRYGIPWMINCEKPMP